MCSTYWVRDHVQVLDAAAEIGGNPAASTRFGLSMDMSRLTRDGTAEPVSRDQILRSERVQGNIHFPCSADYEQDWQPYPVDPCSCYCTCDEHTMNCRKNYILKLSVGEKFITFYNTHDSGFLRQTRHNYIYLQIRYKFFLHYTLRS